MNNPEQPDSASLRCKLAGAISHPLCMSLLLAAATLTVYWPALHCDFVNYDDPGYFYSNDHVLGGLSLANLQWAFTNVYTANWHPLTWISLMLDAEIFGPGPAGPHLTNLLFHAANTVLVFLLLRRLMSLRPGENTGATAPQAAATRRSAFVAVLFALHPLHVESVAWVSERKDVLSAFFGLLSLLFYARYAEKSAVQPVAPKPGEGGSPRSTVFYGLALVCFALGLMSKAMLVTWPFVMLLLDYWPLKRFTIYDLRFTIFRLVFEKIPFFVLAAAASVVTFAVQHSAGAVTPLAEISCPGPRRKCVCFLYPLSGQNFLAVRPRHSVSQSRFLAGQSASGFLAGPAGVVVGGAVCCLERHCRPLPA